MIANLVENAIKYSDTADTPGRVVITASILQEYLLVLVEDTGIGIPPDQWERIFERGYQIIGPNEWKRGGVGFGLAQAREYARSLGGDIIVADSVIHKGSTFKVTIPMRASFKSKEEE
jgi:signal transduction histidine kinase